MTPDRVTFDEVEDYIASLELAALAAATVVDTPSFWNGLSLRPKAHYRER